MIKLANDLGASKSLLRKAFPLGVVSVNLKQVLDLHSPPTAGELKFASPQEYQKINKTLRVFFIFW